mgnify:CR=1 FL=1
MRDVHRAGLGAPNEQKFGFVQTCRVETEIHIAGQVGKDNRSGDMLPAASFAGHVRNAIRNVDEAGTLAVDDGETVVLTSLAVYVPRPMPDNAVSDIRGALAALDVAVTIVGVPALSSPDYRVEISASAIVRSEEDVMATQSVPYPVAIQEWFPGAAAVSVDGRVHAAGHVAVDDGFAGGEVATQLTGALAALDQTLARLGTSLASLTSTHVYAVPGGDALDFDAICRAHREAVGANPPAATLILVDQLPVPGASVMVTATATCPS